MRLVSKPAVHAAVALMTVGALFTLAFEGSLPVSAAQQGGSGMGRPTDISNELLVKFAAGVSRSSAEEILQRSGAQPVGAPTLDGRLFHIRVGDAGRIAAVKAALEATPGVEYVEAVQSVTIQPKN